MDNYSKNKFNPVEEVDFGQVQWYSKPRDKDTKIGCIKSNLDGSEVRFDERALVNRDERDLTCKGAAVIYRKAGNGKRANLVFDLGRPASDEQTDFYCTMLVRLAERLNDPDAAREVQFAKENFSSSKECVEHLRKYLLKKIRSGTIANVDIGTVLFYNYSPKYKSTFGYVRSAIDKKELRIEPDALLDRKPAKGSVVIYETGAKANSILYLEYPVSDIQADRYWTMLVKLSERLKDPDYTRKLQFAKERFSSAKERAEHLREYLLINKAPGNILNADIGTVLFYHYSEKYDAEFGYVRSNINKRELKIDPEELRNRYKLVKGSVVIYEPGKKAHNIFNLSYSAHGYPYQYWVLLVSLISAYYVRCESAVQFAKKFFDSVEDCVNFLRRILFLEAFPLQRHLGHGLAESFMRDPAKYFDLAECKQRFYWCKNDSGQFAKNLKDVLSSKVLETADKKKIIAALPADFLVDFPDYFSFASLKQHIYLYQSDKKLFAKSLEDAKDSLSFDTKKTVNTLPDDFLINFPEYFDLASMEQRCYLYKTNIDLFKQAHQNWRYRFYPHDVSLFPEDLLIYLPEYFLSATNAQRTYLYLNDKRLFAKSLEDVKNQKGSITEIVNALPEDFLINFPGYFALAAEVQLIFLFERDEQKFLAGLEKLSDVQKLSLISLISKKLSFDFTAKYPQYAAFSSAIDLQHKYESDAQNKDLTPEQRRELIYKWSQARGIKYLVHFTHQKNLEGILEKGLLTREELESTNAECFYTDDQRLDGVKGSISLSVSFPNYKMFYVRKKEFTNWDNDFWCVLLLKTEILRDIDCAFNIGNAACNSNSRSELAERMSLDKFVEFFADYGERAKLARVQFADTYATDPQSEILCLGNIPSKYISQCCFYRFPYYNRFLPKMEELGIKQDCSNRWYFDKGPYDSYESYKERSVSQDYEDY